LKFTIRGSFKNMKGIFFASLSSFDVMTRAILILYLLCFSSGRDVTDALMKSKVDELRAEASKLMEDQRKGCKRMFKEVLCSSAYFKNKEEYLSLQLSLPT
jgi:hypothetical protein